ncbi:hypothetical protein RclHR1_05230011 [Rhizophagus clarus]|uniref:Uncharacterized protein n=1 Tax=Rhizophagus clarus TaxID=94130 RepID=A0A2Z6SEW9_9GLOM|nr:hypothetical protein RclHR1_05230011 [Rhizophagus clarus]GES88119.1 hypothetical protein GLOIN_2v1616704 [Rhizophagus clarus]
MVLLENGYSLICENFTISEETKNITNNILISSSSSSLVNNPSSKINVISRCVCDFRINFSGCEEENLLRTLHWILVPYCIILIMIAIGFLYYRNYILKQSFWLSSTRERGYLRPRPQEVIHVTTIVFNLFHVTHILIVLFDAYPNYTIAEIGQDLSRELAIGLALIYPISIIYTTPTRESRNELTSSNIKSPPNRYIVDILGFLLLILPISTLFPFAWMTGHYVDTNDLEKANSIRRIHNLIWVIWLLIFLISLIYNWYKLFIIIWNHIKELKRKEIVSGTSDMQWTVSTLRRAAIHLCLAISSLVIIMTVFLIMSFTYGYFHLSHTIFNYNINITYVIVWNFTIPILQNIIQFFFIYKIIKPKTKHPSSSMTSRFTLTNTTKKDDKRRMEDSLRDDEYLIGGGNGGTLTTTSTPLTPSFTPAVINAPTTTTRTISTNTNNTDYFTHSNSNGLNAAAMNSMTNNILQNKSSIEINRNKAYERLNSRRSLSRSNSQILTSIAIGENSNIEESNSIYPSFLTPKNDYYNRNSIKRPLFIFSDEQTSDEIIDLNSTVFGNISNGKRISAESAGIKRISKSSSSVRISVGTNTNASIGGNENSNNLGVRRISGHIKHQKSFESSMGLIAEENSDGLHRTIMTKRNHSNVSVSREASDATSTTVVTTSTTYTASTTVCTTTTVISPIAAAAAKASWNKPDINDHLNVDERKRLSADSMEKREWLTKRPVSPILRRKTLSKLPNL